MNVVEKGQCGYCETKASKAKGKCVNCGRYVQKAGDLFKSHLAGIPAALKDAIETRARELMRERKIDYRRALQWAAAEQQVEWPTGDEGEADDEGDRLAREGVRQKPKPGRTQFSKPTSKADALSERLALDVLKEQGLEVTPDERATIPEIADAEDLFQKRGAVTEMEKRAVLLRASANGVWHLMEQVAQRQFPNDSPDTAIAKSLGTPTMKAMYGVYDLILRGA